MKYTGVFIIYNPKSTGSSQELAKDLMQKLLAKFPKLKIKLQPTKYAGHAQEIAYKCALSTRHPLIISSSGDGGYNEVINGAMKAQMKGAKPVCAVLAAGNANDHSRTLQNKSLYQAIASGQETKIDLLKIKFSSNQKTTTRFAHSYIGLGLTPVVAIELNKTSLNALKELLILVKTFYKFRPFRIQVASKNIKLDSIIFTNIGEMAKVLTVAKNAKPDDGLFEIVIFPHDNKFKLIRKLAKATATGLQPPKRSNEYDFKVLKKTPVQFDGEVSYIDKNSIVKIEAQKQILRTIL